MKTLCKKFLTGCMALAMACAMAIPTFAAEPQTRSATPNQSYSFQSCETGTYLTASSGTLCLGGATKWTPRYYNGVVKLYYQTGANSNGMVATYNYGPVSLTAATTENSRTSIDILTVNSVQHRIYFNQKDVYISSYGGNVQTNWSDESAAGLKWNLAAYVYFMRLRL